MATYPTATSSILVERLSVGPASTTELAKPFAMALPSFMQHLDVLASAGVVTSQKSGRVLIYQLAPAALGQAEAWLSSHRNHWAGRLDQLDALLVRQAATDHNQPVTPSRKEQS